MYEAVRFAMSEVGSLVMTKPGFIDSCNFLLQLNFISKHISILKSRVKMPLNLESTDFLACKFGGANFRFCD